MGDFIGSTPFFLIMGVLLVAMIGLLIFLQKKKNDDDD
jgi:LPXTG-motif cell wall-anchored protein